MGRAGSASRPSEPALGSLVPAGPIGFVATAECKLVREQEPTQASKAIGVSQAEALCRSKGISEKAHELTGLGDQFTHARTGDIARNVSAIFFVSSTLMRQFGRTMLRNLSIAAISALMIASFENSASGASIGAGNPYPVSNYTCQDGTRLAVRLLGDSASVSVNDAAEVDLPSMGSEGTTYSNGKWTLTIIQGRLSWGVGRAMPSECAGG